MTSRYRYRSDLERTEQPLSFEELRSRSERLRALGLRLVGMCWVDGRGDTPVFESPIELTIPTVVEMRLASA